MFDRKISCFSGFSLFAVYELQCRLYMAIAFDMILKVIGNEKEKLN